MTMLVIIMITVMSFDLFHSFIYLSNNNNNWNKMKRSSYNQKTTVIMRIKQIICHIFWPDKIEEKNVFTWLNLIEKQYIKHANLRKKSSVEKSFSSLEKLLIFLIILDFRRPKTKNCPDSCSRFEMKLCNFCEKNKPKGMFFFFSH